MTRFPGIAFPPPGRRCHSSSQWHRRPGGESWPTLIRLKPPRWVWIFLALTFLRPATAHRPIRAEPSSAGPRPNVLILIADDHAAWTLGCEGDPRRATPRLDRLAAQGVRFDHAYCNSPLCTPSRQSFITGRLPHAVGVTQLTTPLPEEAVTLGDWLGGRGYRTAAIGKMHFNDRGDHGFAEQLDTPQWQRFLKSHPPAGGDHRRPWHPFQDPAAVWLNAACRDYGLPAESMEATYFADRAADFFRRHRDDPFALVVSFHEPHSPFPFPREWRGRYRPEQFPVPPVSDFDRREQPLVFAPLKPDDVRGIAAAYFTSLSWVDHQIGRVLDALDASGLADDTIVVYWGDNGYLLGQHGRFEKHCFYEQAVRVPLMFRWPGHLPAGRMVSDLVEMVDVFPTLLALCGLEERPSDLDGRSLVPLLLGRRGARGRDVVVGEYPENEEAMARSPRYKLIVGTGRRKRQDGYITAHPLPGPYERLYDLQTDPDETTDLAGRPDLAGVVAELRRRLHDRLVTTRGAGPPVPEGLSTIEAIHWCLIPRDRPHKGP
jgi:choline-sulfatase